MLTSYEAFQEYMEKAVELGKMFYNDKYYQKAMEALLLDITDAFANTNLTYRDLHNAIYDIEDEIMNLGEYSVHITPNILIISFLKKTNDDGKIFRRAYVYNGLSVFIFNQYCGNDEYIDFNNLSPICYEVDDYMDDGLLFEIYRRIKRTHPISKESYATRQFINYECMKESMKGGMQDE
jgi:hypothetical protein